jgi:hypothetical protein
VSGRGSLGIGSLRVAVVGLVAASLVACSRTPDEPEAAPATTSAAPAVRPLAWKAPPAWKKSESNETGPRRAGYKVPSVGDDKEEAEALVLFFGLGTPGDRDKIWDEWFAQFDGDAKHDAKRASFEVRGMQVETFEMVGTYKLNMGPRRPGMTKSPVQMVKEHFRMIAAVVHTKDRGNWFFRLVGPDATVAAASSDFRALLDSVE